MNKGEMMERQQSQKEKSLAWFKLADLIARGEREKALNVFRLLSHSLPDRAYVLQLEGDMLWHLEDKGCVEKYKQAAFLYHKEKRWIDAVAIYEHLFSQNPESGETLAQLMLLYALLDWQEKFIERYKILLQLFHDHLISELQVEKLISDVIQTVVDANDSAVSIWLGAWVDGLCADLPESMATRLSIICKA